MKENLPAKKDQIVVNVNWPESLQRVQLAREGISMRDLSDAQIISMCKTIANERQLSMYPEGNDHDKTEQRLCNWLRSHYPHLKSKQFGLAFELYDARRLSEKHLKFKAYKYFTKEFIGIVLDGFKEYNQQKIKEIVQLEQKEKRKQDDEPATPEQRDQYLKVLGTIKKELTDKYGEVKKQKPIISVHELQQRKNRKKK